MTEPIRIVLDVTPVPKPRQTKRDQWLNPPRPAVARYRQFADQLRLQLARARATLPAAGLSIRFDLPMPASWSKRQREATRGTPHQQRPDIDNLLKATLDAAMPNSDCEVWQLAGLEKRWADTGSITLTGVELSQERAA